VTLAAAVLSLALVALADPGEPKPGTVRFVRIANSAFDRYTKNPSTSEQQWMRAKYWRMLAYSPYFDSRLTWFRAAWVYKDLYAIYVGSALAAEHPEWILRDTSGNPLHIRFACSGGTCPQYAADVGDPGFRAHWIAEAAAALAKGYRGLYVDDVNLTVSRVSDGKGQAVAPIDPRTRHPMTEADWRRDVTAFLAQIRTAFPQAEIVHNVIWYVDRNDPAVERAVESADVIGLERGVNDAGIRGGGGTYGFDTFLSYVDWIHAHGKGVLFDAKATTDQAREYGLAAYFLLTAGGDSLANDERGRPDDWWPGYETSLGAPRGRRYAWRGVLRRDFESGFVLLNPPDAPERNVELDDERVDLSGRRQTSIKLGAAAGAVLLAPRVSQTP